MLLQPRVDRGERLNDPYRPSIGSSPDQSVHSSGSWWPPSSRSSFSSELDDHSTSVGSPTSPPPFASSAPLRPTARQAKAKDRRTRSKSGAPFRHPVRQTRYLDEDQRLTILERIRGGEKQADLAKEYHVSRSAISNLKQRRAKKARLRQQAALAQSPYGSNKSDADNEGPVLDRWKRQRQAHEPPYGLCGSDELVRAEEQAGTDHTDHLEQGRSTREVTINGACVVPGKEARYYRGIPRAWGHDI